MSVIWALGGKGAAEVKVGVYGHLLPGSYDDVRARMDAYLARDNRGSDFSAI